MRWIERTVKAIVNSLAVASYLTRPVLNTVASSRQTEHARHVDRLRKTGRLGAETFVSI